MVRSFLDVLDDLAGTLANLLDLLRKLLVGDALILLGAFLDLLEKLLGFLNLLLCFFTHRSVPFLYVIFDSYCVSFVGPAGIEPATDGLKVHYSTN